MFTLGKHLTLMMTTCVLSHFLFVGVSHAVPMTYIYNAPESSNDSRYEYHWEILKTALKKTTEKYGPYNMVQSESMSELRQTEELKKASGKLTVMFLDTTVELEKALIPIRIPVDKNLVGHRVLLIRKTDKETFAAIRTIDDLRKYEFGFGSDWIDVGIYKANRFKVVTGSNYEGLFLMLTNKRFDAFSRGVNEVIGEYDCRKKNMPDIMIDSNILITYPAPMYFWFSRTREGERLAKRVEEGMWLMIKDGTYDKIFHHYFKADLDRLNLKKRRVINIVNPYLPSTTPLSDKRLWFSLPDI